ncbi:MAG: prolyl-tRNA synthetase associated domain-containing protein [Oscillospiraceae bacterium]|nr:prolyl-tRNA synthetase associated domain-containing protein [Oscillospiraceae bacterium]
MTCIPTDIEHGAPAELAVRGPRERRCYEFLDGLGISYRRAEHAAAATMEICRQIEKSLGCPICKNLLLTNRQQTDFYLLLMEGEKVFKTKFLSKALGCARLSFASDEQMEQLVDVSPGSLSVLGLMNDPDKRVRLVIDRPVLEQPEIGFHPCMNTTTLAVSMADFREKILPALGHELTVVELPVEAEAAP